MGSILDFAGNHFERLTAWARYLHWADIHRCHFDSWMEASHDVTEARRGWEFIALLSAWYASLWVVVEGWGEVPLSDPSVDELLAAAPRYQHLLRRYRNGVFHYQPELIDKRLADFLTEGESAVQWTHLLHQEFCRYYWELIERVPVPQALRDELRDSVLGIVGWIPNEIPAARIESLRRNAQRAVALLREDPDVSSGAARDLLEAAQHSREVAASTEQRFETLRSRMLEQIRRDAGSV